MQSCNALLVASAGLVGLALAPRAALATVPLGLQFFATMSLTLPASLLMKRVGRRSGFLIGTLFGVVGAALCTFGIVNQSFALFCTGCASIGLFNAFGQYYRFAAADVAAREYRSRAISYVLAGGIVAAFLGPNLANWTRDAIPAAFAGSYMSLIGLYCLSALVLAFVDIPKPGEKERAATARPVSQIVCQPKYLVAVLGAMIAYGVMNLIMVATPLAMNGRGHSFGLTASVIQWHVVGMYAPSFVTGNLIYRYGALNIMLLGGLLLLGCAAINLSGQSMVHFWSGLALLGVGWNFLFIGATSLLTETYVDSEKALAQGLNDLMVFGTMTLTAFSSGALHNALGWKAINGGVLPVIAVAVLAAWWLRTQSLRSRLAR